MPTFEPPRFGHERPRNALVRPEAHFEPPLFELHDLLPSLPPIEALSPPQRADPNPYGDYERHFAPDGSVRFVVPEGRVSWPTLIFDIAKSLIGAMAGGMVLTVPAQALAGADAPGVAFFLCGLITYFFVCTPPRMHLIEIHADCMILDQRDVFWASRFELGFPSLHPMTPNEEWKLTATYGTRFVEFLTLRPLDKNDRTPQLASSHLQRAFNQLWGQGAL